MKKIFLCLLVITFSACLDRMTEEDLRQSYKNHTENDNWSKALETVNEILRRNPNDRGLYYNKALCLHNVAPVEHYQEVIESLEIYLEESPTASDALLLKYMSHLSNGRYEDAIYAIQTIEKYYGISPHTMTPKGFAYFVNEDYDKAAFNFDESLSYSHSKKNLKTLYYYKIYSKYFAGDKKGALRDITFLEDYGLEMDKDLMKQVSKDHLDIEKYSDITYKADLNDFSEEIIPEFEIEYTRIWQPIYQRKLWQSKKYDLSDLETLDADTEVLNLSQSGITEFPEELERFTKLKILSLSRNKIKDFDQLFRKLGQFENLEYLELNYVNLRNFPSSIAALNQLKGLSFEAANIRKLPKEIGKLRNLRFLSVGNNSRLKDFPEEIKYLKKLSCLDVSGSGMIRLRDEVGLLYNLSAIKANASMIKSIPQNIGNLKLLESLNLGYNNIMEVPESIGDLIYLEKLYLGSNEIEKLPGSIGNLKNLEILSLEYNRLKGFPDVVLELDQLRTLMLHNSYIDKIPLSIGQLDSLKLLYVDHQLVSQKNIEKIQKKYPQISIKPHDGKRLVRGPKRKN